MILTTVAFGQDSTSVGGITPYVAGGLSLTNSNDFKVSSYPSIEVGVMFDNITVAGVCGRNNLAATPVGHEVLVENFWVEAKVAYSFPLGYVDGYGVFGVGTYLKSDGSLFIEYGVGITKSFTDHLGCFIQVSNWGGITYLTPGFSVSF